MIHLWTIAIRIIKKYDIKANKLEKLNPIINNQWKSKNEKTGFTKDWNLYEIMLDSSLIKIVTENNQKFEEYSFVIFSTIDFIQVESEFI